MKNLPKFPLATAILFLMAGGWTPAQAAERIVLRTGSSLICDHHKNVDGEVRLYLTDSNNNYVAVAPEDIVRTESVPAPQQATTTVGSSSSAASRSSVIPGSSATPARVDLPVLLKNAGATHDLDPDLLASVVHAESGGKPNAISIAGAQGLMQLMPETAANLGVRDSFQPKQNIAGGTTYLDALLRYYNENLVLALAAYNAGPGAVNRYGGIPPYPETRRYVARVIRDYNRRKRQEARQQRTHVHREVSTVAEAMNQP